MMAEAISHVAHFFNPHPQDFPFKHKLEFKRYVTEKSSIVESIPTPIIFS